MRNSNTLEMVIIFLIRFRSGLLMEEVVRNTFTTELNANKARVYMLH